MIESCKLVIVVKGEDIFQLNPCTGFFHPTCEFFSARRVTGLKSMCRDPWMGRLHGSRATGLVAVFSEPQRLPELDLPC